MIGRNWMACLHILHDGRPRGLYSVWPQKHRFRLLRQVLEHYSLGFWVMVFIASRSHVKENTVFGDFNLSGCLTFFFIRQIGVLATITPLTKTNTHRQDTLAHVPQVHNSSFDVVYARRTAEFMIPDHWVDSSLLETRWHVWGYLRFGHDLC